jgi:hypothetical protein
VIAPQTGGLTWAMGTVPTPRGTIAVSWARSGTALRLTVTVPHGLAGSVVLPRSGGSFRATIATGGSYTFTVTR